MSRAVTALVNFLRQPSLFSSALLCCAQAFKLFDGYVMERRLLRAAYLQRFPTDDVLAQMAAEQTPLPCAGAEKGPAAADPSSHAPAASLDVPQCPLSVAIKVSCSSVACPCSALLMMLL